MVFPLGGLLLFGIFLVLENSCFYRFLCNLEHIVFFCKQLIMVISQISENIF